MNLFNFIDTILIMGIGQGLFLLLSLQFIQNKNKRANLTLSSIILCALLMLSGRLLMYKFSGDWPLRLSFLADNTVFLLGPFIYTYVRRLLFNEDDQFSLRWIHFIPSAIHLIYVSVTFTYSTAELRSLYELGKLTVSFATVEFLGIVSLLFYLYKAVGIHSAYKENQHETSAHQQKADNFLIFSSAILISLATLWTFSFVNTYIFGYINPYINYETIWICIPFLLYLVGYYSFRQPEIFRVPIPINIKVKQKSQDRLKPKEREVLKSKLDYLIKVEKPYLQSDITLSSLAAQLETSTNNLSWLLNQQYGRTFYQWINHMRLEEFTKKVDNHEHDRYTILALAMKVGFNSKSAFNRAFKNNFGETPRRYIKSIEDKREKVP